MTGDWPGQLARSLRARRLTATLEQQLDALLVWLGNPDNAHAAGLDAAIAAAGLSRAQASARAYDLLDRLLFADTGQPAHRTLGLPPDAEPVLVKRRYRRLIQAYHPDRHPARAAELTDRTERINLAFEAFPGDRPAEDHRSAPRRPTDRPKNRAPYHRHEPVQPGPTLAARLRRSLGAADSFQTRFFTGLILFCALLLGSLIHFGDEPAGSSRPVVRSPGPPVAESAAEAVAEVESVPEPSEVSIPPAPMAQAPETAGEAEQASVPEPDPEPAPAADPRWDRLRDTLVSAWPAVARNFTEPETRADPEPVEPAPAPPPPPAASAPQAEPRAEGSARPEPPPPPPARPEPVWQPAVPPEAVPRPELSPRPAARPEPPPAECEAVRAMLVAFRRAYEAGDLGGFMALYSPAARENAVQGRAGIRAMYADWFERTSERRFSFDRVRTRAQGAEYCIALTDFHVRYRDADRRPVDHSGTIEFRLERHGAGFRILRLSY